MRWLRLRKELVKFAGSVNRIHAVLITCALLSTPALAHSMESKTPLKFIVKNRFTPKIDKKVVSCSVGIYQGNIWEPLKLSAVDLKSRSGGGKGRIPRAQARLLTEEITKKTSELLDQKPELEKFLMKLPPALVATITKLTARGCRVVECGTEGNNFFLQTERKGRGGIKSRFAVFDFKEGEVVTGGLYDLERAAQKMSISKKDLVVAANKAQEENSGGDKKQKTKVLKTAKLPIPRGHNCFEKYGGCPGKGCTRQCFIRFDIKRGVSRN